MTHKDLMVKILGDRLVNSTLKPSLDNDDEPFGFPEHRVVSGPYDQQKKLV